MHKVVTRKCHIHRLKPSLGHHEQETFIKKNKKKKKKHPLSKTAKKHHKLYPKEDIKRLENEICLNGINVDNPTVVNLVQKQN